MVTVTCKLCGKTFERKDTSVRQYCSNECRQAAAKPKYQKTLMERYGVTNPGQYLPFQEKAKRRNYEKAHISADKLPKDLDTHISCATLYAVLDLLNTPYVKNYVIGEYTYSAYVEKYNVVIHVSDTASYNTFKVANRYQLHMLQAAEERGLRCIHIFDWDNIEKIYMLFQPRTRIYARNCVIEELNRPESEMFLNMFHLQGGSQKDRVRYGLYYHDQLVEVMTFCKSRFTKKFDWELLRMCTDCDYQVVGGSSKLFKHFLKEQRPQSVISYCDLAKFTGDVYPKLGMQLYQQIPPNKVWSYGTRRITDRMLCTIGYDELFNANYGKGTSNEQLMVDHGWLPVQDCGQRTYLWLNESEEIV